VKWENSKIKTNHTLSLFSLLLRLKIGLFCFPCFCCIRDSLHPIQVKEERIEGIFFKEKRKSWYEMG